MKNTSGTNTQNKKRAQNKQQVSMEYSEFLFRYSKQATKLFLYRTKSTIY